MGERHVEPLARLRRRRVGVDGAEQPAVVVQDEPAVLVGRRREPDVLIPEQDAVAQPPLVAAGEQVVDRVRDLVTGGRGHPYPMTFQSLNVNFGAG